MSYYYLKQDAAGPVNLPVADAAGNVVRRLQGPRKAGINRVASEGLGGFGGGRGGAAREPMPPGEYTITLETGAVRLTQKARVVETPMSR